jgi:aryl-alcohol dehydrogenase-like predicted oxidoreductase
MQMRTTTLGSSGPEVGVIGLGCMGMSFVYDMAAARDDDTSAALIRHAIDLGMTLIDTADAYGPYTNEVLVGQALAGGSRQRAIVATKVGAVTGTEPGVPTGMSFNGRPEHIRTSIVASLRRLGTDYIDLYQLHRVDPQVPIEDSWGALSETVAAGQVRHLGLSEVTVEQVKRVQPIHPVTTVQSELSLWARDALAEMLPYCEQHGIEFLAYSPLGSGFLTGRFTSFDELPAADARRQWDRFQQDALRQNLAIVDQVRDIATRLDATPAQVALAWIIAQGQHVVPIPGTKTPKYLTENADASRLILDPDTLAELDALPAPVGNRY